MTFRARVARATAWIAGVLLFFAVCALRRTWRVTTVGRPPGEAVLYYFWHGQMVALCARVGDPSDQCHVLTSRSRDGTIASHVARRLGFQVVRGSRSRGSVAAALGLARALRRGECAAVAADGPRGPRRIADDRLVRLADVAGRPIVPVAAVCGRGWTVGSWDRMFIPAPFSRVVVGWGRPVKGDLGGSLDALCRSSENELGCGRESEVRKADRFAQRL